MSSNQCFQTKITCKQRVVPNDQLIQWRKKYEMCQISGNTNISYVFFSNKHTCFCAKQKLERRNFGVINTKFRNHICKSMYLIWKYSVIWGLPCANIKNGVKSPQYPHFIGCIQFKKYREKKITFQQHVSFFYIFTISDGKPYMLRLLYFTTILSKIWSKIAESAFNLSYWNHINDSYLFFFNLCGAYDQPHQRPHLL